MQARVLPQHVESNGCNSLEVSEEAKPVRATVTSDRSVYNNVIMCWCFVCVGTCDCNHARYLPITWLNSRTNTDELGCLHMQTHWYQGLCCFMGYMTNRNQQPRSVKSVGKKTQQAPSTHTCTAASKTHFHYLTKVFSWLSFRKSLKLKLIKLPCVANVQIHYFRTSLHAIKIKWQKNRLWFTMKYLYIYTATVTWM